MESVSKFFHYSDTYFVGNIVLISQNELDCWISPEISNIKVLRIIVSLKFGLNWHLISTDYSQINNLKARNRNIR